MNYNDWSFERMVTTLTQDSNELTLVQSDKDYLYSFSDKLYYGMVMVLSNFDSAPTGGSGTCTSQCGSYTSKLSNFRWTEYDSLV